MRPSLTSIIAVLVLGASSSLALAQSNAAEGARNGADAGGQVLGPIGALVGSVTGAAVGGAADVADAVTAPLAPAPSTVKRTTCVTDVYGNRRCDSIETTN